MKVDLKHLIGPLATAPCIEFTAVKGVLTARGWCGGEVSTVARDEDSNDSWTFVAAAPSLAPLLDLTAVSLSVEGDSDVRLHVVGGHVDVSVPPVDDSVPSSRVAAGEKLDIPVDVLHEALNYLAAYRGKSTGVVDHGCLWLYEGEDGRLALASTQQYCVAFCDGTALPVLNAAVRAVLKATTGAAGFPLPRLLPWAIFSVGDVVEISVSVEGAIIKFAGDDSIVAKVPWVSTQVSQWRQLVGPATMHGWSGTVNRHAFSREFGRVAQYSGLVGDGATPTIAAKDGSIEFAIAGVKGNVRASVTAEGQGDVSHLVYGASLPLKGMPDDVGLVIPTRLVFPASEEGASTMLFYADQPVGEETLRKSLAVVVVD